MQRQDLSGESDDEGGDSPLLQVPASGFPAARPDQTGHNNRLSWTDTTPSSRRPPKAGPGLSLKQQASSPRWSARRGVGTALISPASALRQGTGTVSGQSRRSSQLGLPVRSRRALSQDEPDHAAADTWPLHRAQSVMVPKSQRPDLDKPFIELSELESFCEQDGDRQLHQSAAPDRNASIESLPSWRDEAQEVHQAHVQEQPGEALDASYEYGDWADGMQQEQTEDPKQRLLQ